MNLTTMIIKTFNSNILVKVSRNNDILAIYKLGRYIWK